MNKGVGGGPFEEVSNCGFRDLKPNRSGGAFVGGRRSDRNQGTADYRLFETLLNVVFSLLPTLVMAPIAATAMRAAMRPYSMAVAPLAFFINFTNLAISGLPVKILRDGPHPRTLRV